MWSVDPDSGHPAGLFPVGIGVGLRGRGLPSSSTPVRARSCRPPPGSDVGTFPLYDDFGYVTQESNGDDLFTETASSTADTNDIGYVETVSPTGTVLSTFGSSHIEGNDTHTGSGTQFYYPAQAAVGPDGTIYTADPLSTIQATSPNGYLQGQTTLGGTLNMGSASFYLEGQTFFFQGGPPFDNGGDNISVVSLSDVTDYLSAVSVPDDSLGWGAGLSTPEVGNYFAPGQAATVDANFDPWWSEDASHLDLDYSIENHAPSTTRPCPLRPTWPCPRRPRPSPRSPLTVPSSDQAPGPYLVQASLYDTSHRSPHPARGDVHALHGGGDRRSAQPGRAPVRRRLRRPGRPEGRGPQRRARPQRSARPLLLLVQLPAQLQLGGAHRRHLRANGHDLLLRSRLLLPGGGHRRGRPRDLLGPDLRWGRHLHGPRQQRLVGGRHPKAGGLLLEGAGRVFALCPGDQLGAVERVQQHRVERCCRLREQGARPLLHRRQVGRARGHLDRHRRLHPRALHRLVAEPGGRRRPGRHGRGRHPPLHRQQRLVRRGRDADPGPTAPGRARVEAAVVHRGRVVVGR